MDEVSLAPAAGAHGELAGILIARAYLGANGGGGRRRVLVPDSAHGTNPAPAARAGFEVARIPSAADGNTDPGSYTHPTPATRAGGTSINSASTGALGTNSGSTSTGMESGTGPLGTSFTKTAATRVYTGLLVASVTCVA